MRLKDLPTEQLAGRLRGSGVSFRTGPFVVRFGSSLGELREPFVLLYADYPLADDEPIVDFDIRLDPPSPLRRWIAPQVASFVDGHRQFAPFPRRHALPMLEWLLNWCVFTRPNRYLILHSGVAARGRRAVLLSGEPGAGKSTLCAGLVLRGWRLLSDEVAMIDRVTRELVAVPRPIGLKEGSIRVISRFDRDAVIGPAVDGTRKGTVAHLRPPTDSVDRALETATAAWVVFPDYGPGRAAELRPVSRARALLRVGRNAFNYSVLGAAGFETLADLIDTCECYDLAYGDLEEAVALIGRLAGEPDAAQRAADTRP